MDIGRPRIVCIYEPDLMARILLIEHDDLVRALVLETLALAGHTVIEAGNGEDGLAVFPHAHADLVITDIGMLETNGLEVVIELRKRDPLLPIIAMSGGGWGSAQDTATLLGAARVLLKPFLPDALLVAVNDLLPGDA